MSVESDISGILEKAAEEIKSNLEAKGINATGRTSRAIKVRRIASGFQLGKFPDGEQTAPLQTLEIGRPAGKVPRCFKFIIWDWMDAKGISTGDARVDARIAGAIAYGKIRRIGTNRHQHHEDVFSTTVQETARDIQANIRTIFATRINEIIKTNF